MNNEFENNNPAPEETNASDIPEENGTDDAVNTFDPSEQDSESRFEATEQQKANSGSPYANPYSNPYANPYANPYTAAPESEIPPAGNAEPRRPYANPYAGPQDDPTVNAQSQADYTSAVPPQKPRKNRGLTVFLILLTVVFAFTAMTFAGMYFYSYGTETTKSAQEKVNNGPDLTINSKPQDNAPADNTGKLSVTEIAKKVRPSVVGIVAYSANNSIENLGRQQASSGSGVIMSADGYIITNAHVIDGAGRIEVVLDNEESCEAKIIGSDSKTDLAVIKIDKKNLSAAAFGDSSQTQVGEDVVAIGNPSGLQLAGSLTRGIVSAVERPIQSSSSAYTMNCIQTDAAINPGNSGGALVNMYGQVIGINSSKIANVDYEGIGFAISANDAKPIVDDLIKYGYVKGRAKLGITYQEISKMYASYSGVPAGLYVQSVDESTDCYKQGVRANDIITKVDGKSNLDGATMLEFMKSKKAGDRIKLTVFRFNAMGKGTTLTFTVTLAEDKGTAAPVQQKQQTTPDVGMDDFSRFFGE